MRRGWRLLRQHGRRGRSGQVSAVATILALLLFVSFLATFVFGQLPGQMTQEEFQHQLQVENQFGDLQTAILEAAGAWEAGSTSATPPVVWNQGSLCTPVASVCTSSISSVCTPPLIYNESVNSTTFTFDLTGSHDCTTLNILGNHDTITLEFSGANAGSLVLILYGTNDTVLLNSLVTGSGLHASFYLYGGYDTYEVATTGGSNLYLNTYFIGESTASPACPYDNLAHSSDTYSITGATTTNSIQNLTWYNSNGVVTALHNTTGWPGTGDTGSNLVTGWQNVSSAVSCAFAVVVGPPISGYLTSPVTLNSGGSPPFGIPSSGDLQAEPPQVATRASFAISSVTAAPVVWNKGSGCFGAGSGSCTVGTFLEVYNFSGNSTTLTPGIVGCTGTAACTTGGQDVYNVSGNSNTITLSLSGTYLGKVLVQISGNKNALTIDDSGSCSIRQLVTVVFSGNNDTYSLVMSGCTSAGVGAYFNTTFVGSSGTVCPYGNAANYDKFSGATWASSSGIVQNLTWRNADGLVSAPNSIPENGGGDHLTFANTSGYFQCLFTNSVNTGPYTLDFQSGLEAVLNNRYITPSTVAYDQGAEILGVQNGGSVMISPPSTTFVADPSGIDFSLELVSLVGSSGTATGFGTAAVITHILSVSNYEISAGKQGNNYLPYFYLNITTEFPQAWATFWQSQGAVDPTGTSCLPGPGVTTANCLTPPLGRTSTIFVPIDANQLDLVSVVAQVSIY